MRKRGAKEGGWPPARIHAATVDVGGQDEATTDPIAQLDNPARDYTVCHIFELDAADRDAPGPTYRAVDVWVDHGSRHFLAVAGKPLVHRLLVYLRSWNVSHIVAEATGVGEGLCDWLASAFGHERVTQYEFSRLTKAQLGVGFLSVVEKGRFAYWSDDAAVPPSDGWWFWQQCGHCVYEIKPGGTWERALQWAVPASAKVDMPAGVQPVHDERLVSAALLWVYDELVLAGALGTGQGKAAVIRGWDALEGMGF